jgi:hypothetical protein
MGVGRAFPLLFSSSAPPRQRLGVVLHFQATTYELQVARHFVDWLLRCFHLSTSATVINFTSYALTARLWFAVGNDSCLNATKASQFLSPYIETGNQGIS